MVHLAPDIEAVSESEKMETFMETRRKLGKLPFGNFLRNFGKLTFSSVSFKVLYLLNKKINNTSKREGNFWKLLETLP